MTTLPLRRAAPLAALALLAGCAVGPAYRVPTVAEPAGYKEAPAAGARWLPAAPADVLERGPWWVLFGDPGLDRLAPQVEVSNQNVAAAVAAYAQAEALVRQQRAALWPSLGLTYSDSRSGSRGSGQGASLARSGPQQLGLAASWEPDLWGRLRAGVSGAQAGAQASAADLAAARLSAQAALASNYFSLREADHELDLLTQAVAAYRRALQITQNQYAAGIAQRSDVLQAQTQLATTQANLAAMGEQRALLEHAIALLVGRPPAGFAIEPAPWGARVPAVPPGLPSQLLQRRPDIAAAERAVAAANAQIGVARAAYFPSLTLSAAATASGSSLAGLLGASNTLWSLGASAAQTLFDGGAVAARVEAATAARDQAVAVYRQTVLAAFGAVENQLSATRSLAEQEGLRRAASEAADQNEAIALNQYRQGQVPYTTVVAAQVTALAARQALSQLMAARQNAAVALIQALGGGWHAPGEAF
ncbi:MAG: efflux transporter outer membrane subunit [Burkholderiales bacterium]|nr:efflux transporter outer membrane subunit [Burkholderiales bacterium]